MQFATIAESDAYHADHLFGGGWLEDVEEEDKTKALATASRLLYHHVKWLPGYLLTVSAVPSVLRDATSEFARILTERGDPFAAPDTAGLKSAKLGPLDVEFTSDGTTTNPIPDEVLAMLSVLVPRVGSSLNVPLVRY